MNDTALNQRFIDETYRIRKDVEVSSSRGFADMGYEMVG
jgi:hypothetical protein